MLEINSINVLITVCTPHLLTILFLKVTEVANFLKSTSFTHKKAVFMRTLRLCLFFSYREAIIWCAAFLTHFLPSFLVTAFRVGTNKLQTGD